MPNFSKPSTGGKKPYKSAGAPKGAQREGHRGFRADAAAAPKKRWTQDDRAARTGDRPTGSARPAREDRRPDWSPRDSKPAQRPAYGDRTERPAYGDRKPARPSYGDRPERTERPSYNNDRPARPAYGDRTERPARSERPAYNDRAPRADRPSYDRPARAERPAYNDRAPRTDRPSYDRPARTERPAYNNDRPARSYDRPERTERPSYDRADRPARSYDRPERTERPERPRYERDDRPARSYDRPDRAPRSYDRDDRPAKRESDFYTARATSGPVEDVVLERLEAAVITASDVEGVTFGDLGLGNNIVRQLASMGAEAPFAIQAATIPDVLAGKDVLGRGKTGSGKTIAFGAPLVERLMENNGGKDRQMGRKPRALILAPTRELAQQIDRTVQPIARSVGLFTTTIVGGVPQYKQVSALQRGVDIVIATPGRVEDLIEQGRLDLSNVFVTVLDEADHMCDLGFLEPVQRILQETKEGGQKLLFSATLDKGVATLVKQFLVEPAVHEVAGEDQASSTIDHRVLLIEQRDKRAIIEQLAAGDGKTLIFTRTRAFAEEMSDYLEDAGIPATSLHGDLNQSRRTRNLQLLTSGRVNVLVATDVAARGIHVDDISLVIQADAPEEYKTYLHRSGRTGRAGKQGTVVTLINRNRRRKMDELLGRAEIDATSEYAAPGDALLAELAAL
ncbi:MAG: DEAD/DEAH box helicase [Salinibacterium sp.]|nr:DEAD/DEAH box helicase [Salinibacterium sp.]